MTAANVLLRCSSPGSLPVLWRHTVSEPEYVSGKKTMKNNTKKCSEELHDNLSYLVTNGGPRKY